MIRAARGPGTLGLALVAALSLSACNGGSHGSAAGTDTAGTPSASPEVAAVPTTAGPLTVRQMPPPQAIGAGWTERPDPGDDDQGSADPNAPSTQRRDVGELMDGLVPIGCPDAAVAIKLPRPQYALERTYAGPDDAPGVALVLEFADATGPTGFLDAFAEQVRACPATSSNPDGPVTLQFTKLTRTPERVSAVRRERGADADPNPYLVVVVRAGTRVGLEFLGGVPSSKAPAIGAALIRAIRTA